MKMWKLRIYNTKTFNTESEMVIPDIVAQMIFGNNDLSCYKDYPNNKIYGNKEHTAVFDAVTEGKED